MDRLKKQCLKHFIIVTFILAVVESMIDSLYDDFLFQRISKKFYTVAMGSYILISFGLFVVAAYVFWRLMGQVIRQETARQMEDKNLLIANITHDLKTPITSILGFSKMLADKKAEPDQIGEIADLIYKKSKKTDAMINEMFAYVKLDTTGYELHFERKELGSLVRNLIADLYNEYEQRDMIVDIAIPEEGFYAMVDENEFARAVTNLLVNSYRHNPNGSKIRIEMMQENEKLSIRVMDNGEAIKDEIKSTIFEPFVCGDASRNEKGGSGLGLAITRKIIEKHGGTLSLEKGIKEYTKMFVITL